MRTDEKAEEATTWQQALRRDALAPAFSAVGLDWRSSLSV